MSNVVVDSSDDYIRSEQCSDEYVLSGDEKPLWQSIDKYACAGAAISQALATAEWLATCLLPPGCPLKVVSSTAISEGNKYEIKYSNAHQIHIYVDGGFAPCNDNESVVSAESCNATWAFVVVAVDENMNGKLMCSSGGHVTFNNQSEMFLGEDSPGSFDPELYAQVMARLFLMQLSEPFKVPVFIGYDNISVLIVLL